MEFFSASALKAKSASVRNRVATYSAAKAILASEASQFSGITSYDIFLSHSFLDADIIFGLKRELEANGFSVYVYWIEDSSDRSTVTAKPVVLMFIRKNVMESHGGFTWMLTRCHPAVRGKSPSLFQLLRMSSEKRTGSGSGRVSCGQNVIV